jgi:NDP-sugar pyrophosphorylase family protein
MDRSVAFLYLAGGNGTRIKQLFPHYRKPIIPLDTTGSSIQRDYSRLISYSLRHNRNPDIIPDVFALGSITYEKAEQIREFATRRLRRNGMRDKEYQARVSTEKSRGIANAVVDAFKQHDDITDFIVINADELRLDASGVPVDFERYVHTYLESQLPASLYAAASPDPHLHRVVDTNEDGIVSATMLLNESSAAGNCEDHQTQATTTDWMRESEIMPVFAGACAISREVIPYLSTNATGWSGIIDPLVNNCLLNSYYDPRVEHYINAGTPEEYEMARETIRELGLMGREHVS